MKKTLELSETIIDGLKHIQKLLSEGKNEQTVFLFEDVLVAYVTIARTTETALNEMNNENILEFQVEFSKVADLVVNAYEEKNYPKVQEILQFNFLPKFKKLKGELEEAFKPFLFS